MYLASPGVKKVFIASGLRFDLAVKSPAYVKELVTHYVGGRLKIAPEHTEAGPLSKMMKPGIGAYESFRKLFDKFSQAVGKKQRDLHKAFLRYHDPENWPLLRAAFKDMGRADLIGDGPEHLVPAWRPKGPAPAKAAARGKPFRTRHTQKDRPVSNRPTSKNAGAKDALVYPMISRAT